VQHVDVSAETLSASLSDGRTVTVPLTWYPRLQQATAAQRRNWRLIGGGLGVHWPALDEDVSLAALLAGRRSVESGVSLDAWRGRRAPPER
jgi:hypothetical protein